MNSVPTIVSSSDWTYQPPNSACNPQRILVKPNLGYPVQSPVTVSLSVLGRVLSGLRDRFPNAEISIVEGVCSPKSLAEIAEMLGVYDLLDEGMQLLDADTLPIAEYPNRSHGL
ncbi:MAG: hypothetical protein J7641_07930 [Cyanobacteria bacterium SID2]|nr:hypothetical protein [Cyanobacteria bacterium SID2]MBP0004654.1 hypothetical protein [Cyanobacteria bacterium SBC]